MNKQNLILSVTIIVLILVGLILFRTSSESIQSNESTDNSSLTQPQTDMMIQSTKFAHNGSIPSVYTCDGPNTNPPLSFETIPAGTKSLALIMDDPDAPNGTWTHWVLWNIAPESIHIPDDFVPEGAVQGITSFGSAGYGGPCPPSGEHRYFFRLYALDTILDIDANTDADGLRKAIKGSILEEAELVGKYEKNDELQVTNYKTTPNTYNL